MRDDDLPRLCSRSEVYDHADHPGHQLAIRISREEDGDWLAVIFDPDDDDDRPSVVRTPHLADTRQLANRCLRSRFEDLAVAARRRS